MSLPACAATRMLRFHVTCRCTCLDGSRTGGCVPLDPRGCGDARRLRRCLRPWLRTGPTGASLGRNGGLAARQRNGNAAGPHDNADSPERAASFRVACAVLPTFPRLIGKPFVYQSGSKTCTCVFNEEDRCYRNSFRKLMCKVGRIAFSGAAGSAQTPCRSMFLHEKAPYRPVNL